MRYKLQLKNIFVKMFYASLTMIVLLIFIMSSTKQQRRQIPPAPDFRPLRAANASLDRNMPRNSTKEPPQLFYVRSPKCKMPYVNPFTPELLEIFEPSAYENCTNDESIVTPIFDANRRIYIMQINDAAGRSLLNSNEDTFSCCYKQVIRSGSGNSADNNFELLPCKNFYQNFEVPNHIDGILVECRSQQNTTHLIQEDAFAFIQYRNLTNQSDSTTDRSKLPKVRQPSVLMVGIDSLSRINVRRAMPKTFEFLDRNNWYEMQGYNKIGDNTFPNLMAVLTGFNLTTANDICDPSIVAGLDKCPFVWKRFKDMGYRTAYAEDTCDMSTFNYCKCGFEQPPVDYYLRPFMLATLQSLKEYKRHGLSYCLGRKHSAAYIYDYCHEFANRFSEEPIFGLFWTNHFSHNSYEMPASMDQKMRDYLEGFEQSGVLDTSVVIFFSDHGMRWGPLLDLAEGFLEERLPMLFIWLPQWFRTEYPAYARALDLNRNRLTSPYDLYMTLQHFAQLASPDMRLDAARDCPDCQTLLRLVPFNRTCTAAGITNHWCTCIPYEVVTEQTNTNSITDKVVDRMNAYLEAKKLNELCSNLTLDRVNTAEKKIILDESMTDHLEMEHTYRIKFTTKPNDGSFQATVVYHNLTETLKVDVESISRLNSYANESKCIDDKEAKKYCFCQTFNGEI